MNFLVLKPICVLLNRGRERKKGREMKRKIEKKIKRGRENRCFREKNLLIPTRMNANNGYLAVFIVNFDNDHCYYRRERDGERERERSLYPVI